MHSGLGHWRYRSLFYTTSDWGVTVHSGLGHWRYGSLFYTTSDWGVTVHSGLGHWIYDMYENVIFPVLLNGGCWIVKNAIYFVDQTGYLEVKGWCFIAG